MAGVETAYLVDHAVMGVAWLALAWRFVPMLLRSRRSRLRGGAWRAASSRRLLQYAYARGGAAALALMAAVLPDPRGVYGWIPYRWSVLATGNASAVVLACLALYVYLLRRTLLRSRNGRMRGLDATATRALRRWRALFGGAAALSFLAVNARSVALWVDNRRRYNGYVLLAAGALYVPLLFAVFIVTTAQLQRELSSKLYEAPFSSHSRLRRKASGAAGRLEMSVRRGSASGAGPLTGSVSAAAAAAAAAEAAPAPAARQKSWAGKKSRRYLRRAKQRLFAVQMLLTWVALAVCSALVVTGLEDALENPNLPLEEPDKTSFSGTYAFADLTVYAALAIIAWLSGRGVGHGVVRSRSGSSRSVSRVSRASRADPPSRASSARGFGADPFGTSSAASSAYGLGGGGGTGGGGGVGGGAGGVGGGGGAGGGSAGGAGAGHDDDARSDVRPSGLRYGSGRPASSPAGGGAAAEPSDVRISVRSATPGDGGDGEEAAAAAAGGAGSGGDDAPAAADSGDETPESSVSE